MYAGEPTEETEGQEEIFVIEWPEYSAEIPEGCQAEPQTTVTFLGGSQLGEDWRLIDTSANLIEVETQN